jgi:hypothetical protein
VSSAEEKKFPIQGTTRIKGFSIPWSMIEPYDTQAQINHGGQTLERLAQRGGLGPTEALAVLTDRRWQEVRELSEYEACVEIGKLMVRAHAAAKIEEAAKVAQHWACGHAPNIAAAIREIEP